MKPISRLNASRIIARVDQQEAELVELVRDWLRSEENQARFETLSKQCGWWGNLSVRIFRDDEANDGAILNCFAAHGMNLILSKLLQDFWLPIIEEEGEEAE